MKQGCCSMVAILRDVQVGTRGAPLPRPPTQTCQHPATSLAWSLPHAGQAGLTLDRVSQAGTLQLGHL